MKIKLLTIIALLIFGFGNAQLEPISAVIVGGGGDFTNQPLSPQSNYSRSQTIYYPEQLKFGGEITGLRYFTAFSNSSSGPSPNENLIVKIGHTTKEEYMSGDAFIPDSELTTIGVSTYYANGTEWIFIFDESFDYNGTDNLVIDVEDINPGRTTSALAGFKGAENFGNPPTRSMMSLTSINEEDNTESTAILYENSYAKTQFDGNLERCMWITVTNFDNVTSTSADITVFEIAEANHYRYAVAEVGEAIPETYNTSTTEQFSVSGLIPSQEYYAYVKSDCDAFGNNSDYRQYLFKTRPNTISVPYTIDFEGAFNRDYSISSYYAEVNAEAANNSTKGLMLQGPEYPQNLSWNDSGDPFQNNQNFVRSVIVDADLTSNATNPVFQFDVSQTVEALLRVKIKTFGDDALYSGVSEDFIYNATLEDNDFKTVSIDLSDYVGELITIKLEHVSEYTNRKTYLDNLKLVENDCEIINNITSQSSLDAISLNWNATTENSYEVVVAPFESIVGVDYTSVSANNYAFTDLPAATSYKLFVRNKCGTNDSPWEKLYASTDPEFLEVGFDADFDDATFTNGYFSIINTESSKVEVINYFNNEAFTLHQRNSHSEWVGGVTTTEAQAWNDNKDFITGVKFRIDGTSISEGSIDLTYRLLHIYGSTPETSWFRILVNGTQVGPSYNPVTRYQDPFTTLNIDLQPYLGDVIEFELQQVGRAKDDFRLSASGGDGTILKRLVFNGESLSIDDNESSEVSLYPNPATLQLNIEGLKENNQISIFDMNGRLLNTFQSEEMSLSLNISEYNTGLYFVEIKSVGKSQTYKFIKQ